MVKWGIILGIVMVAASAFWYVSGLRADLEQSQANVQELKSAVTEQQNVIDTIRKEQEQIRKYRNELNDVIAEQRSELNDLETRFEKNSAGDDRNVGSLAYNKSELVENIINDATAEAARCLEIASGAELTQEEKNATKESEINSECPSIANPSYSGSQ